MGITNEAEQQERVTRLTAYADRLRVNADQRRESANARFPGSVIAGPARYPVARHEKAHNSARKAYEEWQEADHRATAAQRHLDSMKRKAEETDALAQARGEVSADLQIGERVRVYWTNCNNYHTAIGEVQKINARTVRVALVDDLPKGYENSKGRAWGFPKIGTPGNRIEKLPA